MRISIRYLALTTALAAGAFAACSSTGSSTSEARQGQEIADAGAADADAEAAAPDLSQPQLAVCSDGQVAAILHSSGKGEIDLANAVLDRLEDPSVKAFAQRMITDHTALDEALTAAVGQAGITMEETDISKELDDSAQLTIQELSSKSGSELDRSYMAHEVVDHLKDLGLSDHLLAPSIKDPTLLAVATQERAAVALHAQLAVQVQSSVAGQCGVGKEDAGAGDAGAGDGGDAGEADAGGGTTDAGGGTADAGGGGTTME